MLRNGAELSPCGAYRYTLTRQFRIAINPPAIFVTLHPGTATAARDDAFTRRCIGLAQREGYGGLMIVSLYGLRATTPRALFQVEDPVGPENDTWLLLAARMAAQTGRHLICVWGTGAGEDRVAAFAAIAERVSAKCACLGKTKMGAPKNLLNVSERTLLEAWP